MISRQFCSFVFRLDFSFSYPAIREGFSKLSFISPLTAPALAGLFFTGWLELLRAGTFYPARNIIGFEGQFSASLARCSQPHHLKEIRVGPPPE
jgi:hypothetical protein